MMMMMMMMMTLIEVDDDDDDDDDDDALPVVVAVPRKAQGFAEYKYKMYIYTVVPRWFITTITRVYHTYNYSIHGVYKPTNISGGPILYIFIY